MARRQDRLVFTANRSPHRVRRFFVGLGVFILLLLLIAGALSFITSHRVQLETLRITVSDLPGDLNGFSILHLSDLHGATLGREQAGIGRVTEGVSCSCVVFTGDMLTPEGGTGPMLALLDVLGQDEGVPKYYFPGDEDPDYLDASLHGNETALADWAFALAERGVTVLDRPVLFTRGQNGRARLWIVPENVLTLGLDSYEHEWRQKRAAMETSGSRPESLRVADYHLTRAAEIRERVADMRDTDILVLVSHRPVTEEYARYLNDGSARGDLFVFRKASAVLSGHLCGGQWLLPGLGPVYVPDYGWFPGAEGISGLNWVAGVPQYISPGLGASARAYPFPPVRVFNPPTVTKIILTNSAAR